MKINLIINLTTKDCEKIFDDLNPILNEKSGLSPETYLLFNKIKGMVGAYTHILQN